MEDLGVIKRRQEEEKQAMEDREKMWLEKEQEWLARKKTYKEREELWRAKEQAWLQAERKYIEREREILQEKCNFKPKVDFDIEMVEEQPDLTEEGQGPEGELYTCAISLRLKVKDAKVGQDSQEESKIMVCGSTEGPDRDESFSYTIPVKSAEVKAQSSPEPAAADAEVGEAQLETTGAEDEMRPEIDVQEEVQTKEAELEENQTSQTNVAHGDTNREFKRELEAETSVQPVTSAEAYSEAEVVNNETLLNIMDAQKDYETTAVKDISQNDKTDIAEASDDSEIDVQAVTDNASLRTELVEETVQDTESHKEGDEEVQVPEVSKETPPEPTEGPETFTEAESEVRRQEEEKQAMEDREKMWLEKEQEWLALEKTYKEREELWRAKEQAWLQAERKYIERERELLQEKHDFKPKVDFDIEMVEEQPELTEEGRGPEGELYTCAISFRIKLKDAKMGQDSQEESKIMVCGSTEGPDRDESFSYTIPVKSAEVKAQSSPEPAAADAEVGEAQLETTGAEDEMRPEIDVQEVQTKEAELEENQTSQMAVAHGDTNREFKRKLEAKTSVQPVTSAEAYSEAEVVNNETLLSVIDAQKDYETTAVKDISQNDKTDIAEASDDSEIDVQAVTDNVSLRTELVEETIQDTESHKEGVEEVEVPKVSKETPPEPTEGPETFTETESEVRRQEEEKQAMEDREKMWLEKEQEWLALEKTYKEREELWRAKEQAWLQAERRYIERERELLQEKHDFKPKVDFDIEMVEEQPDLTEEGRGPEGELYTCAISFRIKVKDAKVGQDSQEESKIMVCGSTEGPDRDESFSYTIPVKSAEVKAQSSPEAATADTELEAQTSVQPVISAEAYSEAEVVKPMTVDEEVSETKVESKAHATTINNTNLTLTQEEQEESDEET